MANGMENEMNHGHTLVGLLELGLVGEVLGGHGGDVLLCWRGMDNARSARGDRIYISYQECRVSRLEAEKKRVEMSE